MNAYLSFLIAISASFASGVLASGEGDITELPCGGCKGSAYAQLDYGNGSLWIDPDAPKVVSENGLTGGTMTITNITGPEANGQCHCHYEREDPDHPWVLTSGCHQKTACTASITVEATPSNANYHVDIDGVESGGGAVASATATATGCGDPTVTKVIKFEVVVNGNDAGGVTVNALCSACGTNCPDAPN